VAVNFASHAEAAISDCAIPETATTARRSNAGEATFSLEMVMSIGTVKWFDSKKGFGFIVNDEGKDVFVHFSSINGDGYRVLKDGEKVEYEQADGGKGLSARNVRRVAAAAPVREL
jgi:CspA family cold shock protein